MGSATLPPAIDSESMMKFAFKVVGDLAAAISGPLIYIGDRLGLFKILAESEPMTIHELAEKSGLKNVIYANGHLQWWHPSISLTIQPRAESRCRQSRRWCLRKKIARSLWAAWRR